MILRQVVLRIQPEVLRAGQGFQPCRTQRPLLLLAYRIDGIAQEHKADVMLIHTILLHCRPELPHLCIDDAERIIRDAKPRLAILTHYGMAVWHADPQAIAADLTQRIGSEVRAAHDGMTIEL